MTVPEDLHRQLSALRPVRKGKIMDLVATAGVDVSQWARRSDGFLVEKPAANPNFSFEWAFGGNGEPNVLCVWHSSLRISNGLIVYEGCMREFALQLDQVAIDRTNPENVRSRARRQAQRARRFDTLLQRAFRKSESVRFVILHGEPRSAAEIGWESSKVKYRRLDDVSWTVTDYRDDGSFRVVRGVAPASEAQPAEPEVSDATSDKQREESRPSASPPAYLDQFSIPDPPERRASQEASFARSAAVREAALARAAGVCECCGHEGFKTVSGAIYLETHHVIPLCNGGPDVEWNVVAICPNDHRRAHHGTDSDVICGQLMVFLSSRYPAASDALKEFRASFAMGKDVSCIS
ncbi:MAG: HNH endonuclease [Methyloversatilis discipulorum]|uniref:HNH endonuclease n=1 Tax=Methyloversatilis discipulorum TaxID=1119528 RepID=UPI0026F09AB6|nr:HNH endonuclease signature motif containing protein [Methyloversatilis discipulorum]MBV5285229.1 HNH endonuclease [Methyloversatilis discipulorum]